MQLPFELTILGSSSAMPTSSRYPTAQVLNVLGRFFLIDCGEGTQLQLRKNKISFSKINHILISHLHGDHIFGLIGLISTQVLMGRKNDLHIYAHSQLQEYIEFQLKFLGTTEMSYKLIFHPLNFKKPQIIFNDEKLTITSFPLNHRISCCGFRFDENPKEPNIIKEKIKEYNIPIKEIKNIKAGSDFIRKDGTVIPNQDLVLPPTKCRSYTFCSDTKYNEKIIETIKGTDLLYHEATFADSDKAIAEDTFHSTGSQAAMIAKKADVGKLLIGHFSSRYKSVQLILNEAKAIFQNTEEAVDGNSYHIS
ncbi:ribonuclease Z [Sunxiuqinia sp. A32]|uniref:ribonuclease Z n=1 Tax=Sunxiuqinia sp. A32 TaxID=3461496 RepID=UPI0040461A5B